MGSAIAQSILKQKGGFQVYASDHNPNKLRTAGKWGVIPDLGLKHLKKCDLVVIAVKPQDISGSAQILKGKISARALIISIAAGVSLKVLIRVFRHSKIVRLMPNMGLLVGEGVGAWKALSGLSFSDKALAKKFISSFTENFEVKSEALIDAVTAISGSGPAYFFYFAQALEDAARSLGLTQSQAAMLVRSTFFASAKLQLFGDYGQLIKKIASKKGTTEAALQEFKKSGFKSSVKKAASAAYKRAKELSHG